MATVKNYLSLIKFSHTVFALPFALVGFFLGALPLLLVQFPAFFFHDYMIMPGMQTNGLPPATLTKWPFIKSIPDFTQQDMIIRLALIIGCMVFARSAAMAFNRWLDARFDAKNPRTAIREIPAGVIKPQRALIFVIVNCLLFMICTWFINNTCFYLSPVALAVILGYSYTKRFTVFCHLVLGLGLSLAPIGAYLAVVNRFDFLPLVFSSIVFFWVSGFDIIYALQDEEFDKANQLQSIPAWLGKKKALRVSELFHGISAAGIITAGILGNFGWIYWMGAGLFIGLLIYQHRLVKPEDLSRVNLAFFTTNGVASVLFALFTIADLILR